ncbi:SIR2 family protein [Xylanibacter rarus]|uniref:SIR2 family protein n=1 Tax=Xylanibacter rarus TaxID=1676614 RepID=UPI003FEEFF4B
MDITIKNLKQLIQSSHINFLYGSGLSRDYLSTLGNIEKLLTETSEATIEDKQKNIIKSSLFATYVETVMEPCLSEKIKGNQDEYDKTFQEYVRFLNSINHIISRRNVNLIDKQINLFTTNIDDFMEKAAEKTMVEFNDGFKGHIEPVFSEDSFSTIKSKSSTLYQNNSPIPVFNLLKIHGSINWMTKENSEITYDAKLSLIRDLSEALNEQFKKQLIKITDESKINEIVKKALENDLPYKDGDFNHFNQLYSKLVMINPTKAKFRETVIDYHFYELMRIYSNALERSSSLLIVAGFSFADEHIANITMRAANANPTLQVIIFAYNGDAKKNIKSILGKKGICNNNISIISPEDFKAAAIRENPDTKEFDGLECFDFKSINDFVFDKLVSII